MQSIVFLILGLMMVAVGIYQYVRADPKPMLESTTRISGEVLSVEQIGRARGSTSGPKWDPNQHTQVKYRFTAPTGELMEGSAAVSPPNDTIRAGDTVSIALTHELPLRHYLVIENTLYSGSDRGREVPIAITIIGALLAVFGLVRLGKGF